MSIQFAQPRIRSLGAYHPKSSGKHDQYSRMILDFKKGRPDSVRHFEEQLRAEIPDFCTLVVFPGHDPAHPVCPLHGVVERICCDNPTLRDASRSLRRTHYRQKSAYGNHFESHLHTLGVFQKERIVSQNVLLLDDVSTTGNSIAAGRQLLLEAGASSVSALTLAKTYRR